MVAEAGWEAATDHIAIAYVLARRWRRVKERFTSLRFVDVVRTYCTGLGNYRRSLTPRQQWLRSLNFAAEAPQGWPTTASWSNHESFWRAALARSQAWFQGRLRDPCRGRAEHWGGIIDSPQGRMVPIDCGETRNTFYRLDRSGD